MVSFLFGFGFFVGLDFLRLLRSIICEEVEDVVDVEAPLGGVAQVIFHGVRVVEVGLQVTEHQDRGEEEDGRTG